MVAKKAAGSKKSTGPIANPYEKSDPKFKVAALMLKKGDHSWAELIEAAGGTLSTRTMGYIIRDLEKAGARFEKFRDPEYGTCYRLNPDGALLGNKTGPDATGDRKTPTKKEAPAKAAKGKGAKKASGPTPKKALVAKAAKRNAEPTKAKGKSTAKAGKAAPAAKAGAKKAAAKTTAKVGVKAKAGGKPVVKARIGAKKG